jgi:hypothetical protein
MGGFQFFDMKNLAIFSQKIAIFFQIYTRLKKSNWSQKKRVFRELKKKGGKKMGKKERKTSRNPKVFFIICDIVALPTMT